MAFGNFLNAPRLYRSGRFHEPPALLLKRPNEHRTAAKRRILTEAQIIESNAVLSFEAVDSAAMREAYHILVPGKLRFIKPPQKEVKTMSDMPCR